MGHTFLEPLVVQSEFHPNHRPSQVDLNYPRLEGCSHALEQVVLLLQPTPTCTEAGAQSP